MATYNVAVGGLPMASDVNQLVNIFNGSHDVGSITFAPQLSAPSTSLFTLTAQAGTTLGVGTYSYYISYVTGQYKSDGKTLVQTGETLVSSPITITTVANNTNIQIGLPTTGLPASAVAFNIYRSVVGGSSGLFLATVKFGNSSYTDSTADSALGAAAPTTNTTGTSLNLNGGSINGIRMVITQHNTLDDGAGNMTVGGNITANGGSGNITAIGNIYKSGANDFFIVPSSGKKVGLSNNARSAWGLYVSDGTNPSAYTLKNTLDDGNGNMTVSGSLTSGGNYTSNNSHFILATASALSSAGSGGILQMTDTTATGFGYGIWTNYNAYYNGTNWIQPRGSLSSFLYTVNYHNNFSWYYAPAGNTDGGTITPTQAAHMDGNGNLTVNGKLISKNNTLDDGSGNMNVTGNLVISSSAIAGNGYIVPASGKLIGFVNNAANAWGLRVQDGVNPSTYTNKNTLDDGSGNATFNGSTLTLTSAANPALKIIQNSGTAGSPSIVLTAAGSSWNPSYIQLQSTYLYSTTGNGSEFRVGADTTRNNDSFYVNTATDKVTTVKNTLDDGSGNMTLTGVLNALDGGRIGNSTNGYLRIATGSGGVYLEAYNGANNGSTTLNLTGYSGQATTVKTPNNTLDDGNGNMTMNNITSSGAVTVNGANVNIVGGSTDASLSIKGKGVIGSFPGWNANSLYINAYSNGGTNTTSYTNVNIRGIINTDHNTLDDGTGNMTIGAPGSATSNLYIANVSTATNATKKTQLLPGGSTIQGINGNLLSIADAGAAWLVAFSTAGELGTNGQIVSGGNITAKGGTIKAGVGGSVGGALGVMPSNGGTWWWVDNSNGVFRISQGTTPGASSVPFTITNNTVATLNNTLDDGSGNMTVAGSTTLNGALTANSTIQSNPNATATSTQTAYSSHIHRFMNSTWNGSTAVSNFRDFYMDGSGNFVFTNMVSSGNTTGVATLDTGGNLVMGALYATAITKNGASDFYIVPSSGKQVGFVNNAQNAWGLRISDSANPAAYSNKSTLDDGIGNMTVAGNVSVGGALTLTGANAIKLDNYGNISAVGTTSSTWNVVDKNSVDVFYVTMSGAKSVGTSNFQIDDGNGNIVKNNGTFAIKNTNPSSGGYIVLQSLNDKVYLQSPSSMGIYCVAPNTTATYVPIAASAFNVNSMESAKTNIEAWDVSALDLIDQSVIYEYNLKAELAEGLERKRHGFVIGRETPEAIIDNDAIDTYGMSALTVKAIQELNDKVAKLEALVAELLAR